jgi:hypothetical protein
MSPEPIKLPPIPKGPPKPRMTEAETAAYIELMHARNPFSRPENREAYEAYVREQEADTSQDADE